MSEGSWWRIVDVVGALEARQYAHDEPAETRGRLSLTMRVEDDERLAPWNTGTWTLSVGADGKGSVSATMDAEPEVTIGIAALTNLWTGAVSAKRLSDWCAAPCWRAFVLGSA